MAMKSSSSLSIIALLLKVCSSSSAFFSPKTSRGFPQHQAFYPPFISRTKHLTKPHDHPSRYNKSQQQESPIPHYDLIKLLMSNVGGDDGGDDNDKPNNSSNYLDDFLDPKKASEESENLKRARAALSENVLPITFDEISSLEDEDIMDRSKIPDEKDDTMTNPLVQDVPGKLNISMNNTDISNNPYLQVVAKLSPSDLISKFTSTAHPRVQDAVRSTILGLIGTLPKMAFDTTTITTGEKLASLMFQLQMTGYMFKNAEYRLSLSQSLGMSKKNSGGYLLEGTDDNVISDYEGDVDDDDNDSPLMPRKISGKIKVRYGKKENQPSMKKIDSDLDDIGESINVNVEESAQSTPLEVEVDAEAYMAELRHEVAQLREDLISTRKSKEETIRKDLLLYIRTLPQQELNTLTNTMSNDVLGAMKGLVNVVMGGIGEGQIDKNTITEQSGEAMAQLCMWQLVVGYNLRELEVREEMKNTLISGKLDNDVKEIDENGGSINYDEGGFE